MAILNVSFLNQYNAESLKQTGFDALQNTLSDGTLPDDVMAHVFFLVTKANLEARENGGVIPNTAYQEIARVMLPSSPGFTVDALVKNLKSTNVFGLAGAGVSIDGMINDALASAVSQYNGYITQISSKISNSIYNIAGRGALSGITENIASAISNQVGDAIKGLFPDISLDKVTAQEVSKILAGGGENSELNPSQKVEKAIETIKESLPPEIAETITGQKEQEMKSALGEIQGTIAGTVDNLEDLPALPPYEIGSDDVEGGGRFISSLEELEAEMSSATRPISEVIVHWSETFTNANLTGQQLQTLTGAGIENYHIIIKRDGSIERGLPINEVGDHTQILNHNQYSIGVCLVGGVNVASGTGDITEVTTAMSITRSQFNTLYHFFRVFYNQYPGGQALGHMDVDITEEDPGFDVRDYVFNNFNKLSLYTDPLTEPAKSPDEIIAALDDVGTVVFEKDPDVLEKKF
jgi:hypothetical protein